MKTSVNPPAGPPEPTTDPTIDPLAPRRRRDFPLALPSLTRWSDNDMYGHLNNAVYYELFDSAINTFVGRHLGTDFAEAGVIGVVAESACRFHQELSFPGELTVGLAVDRVGRSSITYRLGLFAGSEPEPDAPCAATGRWVHVYIRRGGGTEPIPGALRDALTELTAG